MFKVISRQRHQATADPTHYHYTDQLQREEQSENSDTGKRLHLPHELLADHQGEFTSLCVYVPMCKCVLTQQEVCSR